MDEAPTETPRRDWSGFWSVIVQQTQNAFNDSAARLLLLALAGSLVGAASSLEFLAGIWMTLPFILCAPVAGWLSDRFSMRDVMIGAAVGQSLILVGLSLAVVGKNLTLALIGFFALAVQAVLVSPAKVGIVKELVGSRYLGFASCIQQMSAAFALFTVQVAAGFIFYDRLQPGTDGWPPTPWPLIVIFLLSLPAIGLAWTLPRTPPGTAEPLSPALAVGHLRQLGGLWRDPVIRRAAFGTAFFWGFAGFLNLWSIGVAKELTEGGIEFVRMSFKLIATVSLAMAAGFGIAALLSRRRIELGWVPVAGMAMTLSTVGLALVNPGTPTFLALLALTALSAAIFLGPLSAFLQDRCPAGRRGGILAAANMQDGLAGALMLALLLGLSWARTVLGDPWWLQPHAQLLVAGAACGLITIYIARLIPADLVRVVGLMFIRMIYRIQSTGTLPPQGGVLLLPNHVTWADAFFLTAACPRPVRFIMEEGFMGTTAIRVFCQLFDTVPISSAKPREALRAASDSLKQGHIVCIFPEGQLTRTGTLRELKRGFELIARQAHCPLVPAWIGGAWGSIFSFEGNRFFTKIPRRPRYAITVAFGPPISPAEADLERIRLGMMSASARALDAHVGHDVPARANAFQIAHVNALPRGGDFGVLEGDPLPASLSGLLIFERLFRAVRRKSPRPDPNSEVHWLGGNVLRESIEASPSSQRGGVFFDFSDRAVEPLDHPGWLHCPCLAIGGIVVALSMPDQPVLNSGGTYQSGRKPGSLGILLPGFSLVGTTLGGPAIPSDTTLPDGFWVDEEGFVFPSTLGSKPE